MTSSMAPVPLLRPDDGAERKLEKLQRIVDVLMKRVEAGGDESFDSYAYFQTAVEFEEQVKARTQDLEVALAQLNQSKAHLADAKVEAEKARADLAGALEAVKEGFALFDAAGRLILSNQRFARMFPDVVSDIAPGLSLDSYFEKVSNSSALVLEQDVTPWIWRRDRATKLNQKHADFVVEIQGDRWVQISQQRTPNDGTAILQTEVTDMVRQARQERDKLLDDQAKIVRATLDHINQGVCIFDEEDRLAGWNTRFLDLMSPPIELMRAGTSFERFVSHFSDTQGFAMHKAPKLLVQWVQKRRTRDPLKVELHRADGLILDVFSDMTPDNGFVISFTDVTDERATTAALHEMNETLELRVQERTTEMQKARDAAERANTSKSRFLAAASHDLLQPLNAAKLFISSLEEADLNQKQSQIAGRVKSAFDSVETILGALLDISKLDAGTQANISVFPLSRLLVPLRDEFQALARAKGVQFHVVDCGLDVESDPAFLRRIIQNLAANAVSYTDRGKVLVGVRRRGSDALIEVIDTGQGIPDDQRDRVFHEFHRIKRPDETAPGMGLGLAIVRRACDLLGHDLTLQSVEEVGTRFTVRVPYHVPKGSVEPVAPMDPSVDPIDLTDMIPLVIENEAAVRLGMMTLLDSWGASPIEAENLEQADGIIQEIGVVPDVILADYHLENGYTGMHAIRTLRAAYGPIPAALITANRSEHLVIKTAEEDVKLFYKPLQPKMLREYLARLKAPSG